MTSGLLRRQVFQSARAPECTKISATGMIFQKRDLAKQYPRLVSCWKSQSSKYVRLQVLLRIVEKYEYMNHGVTGQCNVINDEVNFLHLINSQFSTN
jgi:hypothetical protein